jgi:hypothetical protein
MTSRRKEECKEYIEKQVNLNMISIVIFFQIENNTIWIYVLVF